jgi:hypothetical protein
VHAINIIITDNEMTRPKLAGLLRQPKTFEGVMRSASSYQVSASLGSGGVAHHRGGGKTLALWRWRSCIKGRSKISFANGMPSLEHLLGNGVQIVIATRSTLSPTLIEDVEAMELA